MSATVETKRMPEPPPLPEPSTDLRLVLVAPVGCVLFARWFMILFYWDLVSDLALHVIQVSSGFDPIRISTAIALFGWWI
jgi:hypothetical protein